MTHKQISYDDIKTGSTYYQQRKVLRIDPWWNATSGRQLVSKRNPAFEEDRIVYLNLSTKKKGTCSAATFAKWMRVQEKEWR